MVSELVSYASQKDKTTVPRSPIKAEAAIFNVKTAERSGFKSKIFPFTSTILVSSFAFFFSL
jgi:hypothetical protein